MTRTQIDFADLYDYAHRVLRHSGLQQGDIDDIAQDAMLRLWQYVGKRVLRRPHAVLWAILRSALVDHIRRAGRRQECQLDADVVDNRHVVDTDTLDIDDMLAHAGEHRDALVRWASNAPQTDDERINHVRVGINRVRRGLGIEDVEVRSTRLTSLAHT